METSNDRLKAIRNQLELTQRRAAFEIGVKPSYYSDLENVRRKISPKFAEKLRIAFNVSPEWLLTGKGEKFLQKSVLNMYPKNVPHNVPGTKLTKESVVSKQNINDYSEAYPSDYWEDENFYLKSNFEKRLLFDIKDNYPEISELYFNLNELKAFHFAVDNLSYYYFNRIDRQFHSASKYLVKGKFDYEKYKSDYFKELENLNKIKPALTKIVAAIREFYKEIKPFDTENVVEGFFNGEVSDKDET